LLLQRSGREDCAEKGSTCSSIRSKQAEASLRKKNGETERPCSCQGDQEKPSSDPIRLPDEESNRERGRKPSVALHTEKKETRKHSLLGRLPGYMIHQRKGVRTLEREKKVRINRVGGRGRGLAFKEGALSSLLLIKKGPKLRRYLLKRNGRTERGKVYLSWRGTQGE